MDSRPTSKTGLLSVGILTVPYAVSLYSGKKERSAHLEVVVLVGNIVTLEVTAAFDTGSEHILRKVLLVSNRSCRR